MYFQNKNWPVRVFLIVYRTLHFTANFTLIIRCVWRRGIDRKPVPKLFAKFRSDFDIADAPRSGQPVEPDEDITKLLIDANRRTTTREIANRFNFLNSTIHDHLKGLGLTSKLNVSFSCSYENKFVPFHWRLWFVS